MPILLLEFCHYLQSSLLLDCHCNQDQHVNVAHPLCSCHLRTPPSPKERRRHSRRSSLPRRASCFCSSLKLEKEALVIMDCRQVVSRLLTASCIADRPRIVAPVAALRLWFCLWHWLCLIISSWHCQPLHCHQASEPSTSTSDTNLVNLLWKIKKQTAFHVFRLSRPNRMTGRHHNRG